MKNLTMRTLTTNLLSAAFALICLMPLASLANDAFVPELQPNPEYLPDEVVGIQMRALANNDQPFGNAGIELTFRFASPSNKANTGPLDRFSKLFNHPAYQPMINHQGLEIGSADIREQRARVPVFIDAKGGGQMAYVFILSKQAEGPYMNCWMTDSVTPIQIKKSDSSEVM